VDAGQIFPQSEQCPKNRHRLLFLFLRFLWRHPTPPPSPPMFLTSSSPPSRIQGRPRSRISLPSLSNKLGDTFRRRPSVCTMAAYPLLLSTILHSRRCLSPLSPPALPLFPLPSTTASRPSLCRVCLKATPIVTLAILTASAFTLIVVTSSSGFESSRSLHPTIYPSRSSGVCQRAFSSNRRPSQIRT